MTVAVDGADGSHRSYRTPSSPPLTFHLLEVTLISAQDLHPADCWMQAYADAWVHPDRKLRTRIDPAGTVDPNWNDKFVFRVDDAFLKSDTSAVTIDIFSSRRFRRDCRVGTVRLVLSALNPSATTRFVALQVRRPKSLRPQGIINVGVALVDAYIHNVPMDSDAAFALKDLVGGPMRTLPHEWNGHGMDRSNSVNVGNKLMEREAEELESKLEKWRIELSPMHDYNRSGSKKMKRRRSWRKALCFCCGGGNDMARD